MCIDFLCSKFCKKWDDDSDVPNPDIVGIASFSELYTVIRSEVGEDVPILLPDNHYELATLESFKKFLENDNTDKYIYSGDPGLNCDDFASILQGRASIPKWATVPIGSIWCTQPAHALNIFVDENLEVWLCESQNDKIFKLSNDWVPYIVWF